MRKDTDRLSQRIAALNAARPVACEIPEAPRKSKRIDRKEPREKTYRFGRVFIRKEVSYRCIVRDISPSGARIALECRIELPEIVLLRIDQSAFVRKARVAWRMEEEAGLEFLVPKPAPAEQAG
jgi:hypothetical protein